MSDSMTPKAEGFVRFRKVSGKHHMYCPVRERKVLLGPGQVDGDIAYLTPAGSPAGSNESWKCLDEEGHVAEVTEGKMQEVAGKPEGTLYAVHVTEGVDIPYWNVINTATDKLVNTAPLTKEQAEAIVAGSPVEQAVYDNPPKDETPEEKKGLLATIKDKVLGDKEVECPGGHKFGEDHDEHEDCDDCGMAVNCETAKQGKEE